MKVSFDYDGTLARHDVQEVAKDLVERGIFDVCILTTRYSNPSKYKRLWEGSEAGKQYLLDQHQELFDVAKKVGITEINFTEFEWKTKFVDKLGIDVHLDDNFREEVSVINWKNKTKAIYCDGVGWKKELYDALGIEE